MSSRHEGPKGQSELLRYPFGVAEMQEPRSSETLLHFFAAPHPVDATARKGATLENRSRCLRHLSGMQFAWQLDPPLHSARAVSPAAHAGSVAVPCYQQVLPPFSEQAAAWGRCAA